MKLTATSSFLVVFIFLFIKSNSISAQSVSGTVFDKETQQNIAFATIQIGENYGVVSNDEGRFNISTERFTPNDSLVFSFMGYDRKAIAIKDFNTEKVYLNPNINTLKEVYLLDKNLDAMKIMERVTQNLDKNYSKKSEKRSIFQRTKNNNKTENSNIDITKADFIDKETLKNVNSNLKELSEASKKGTSNSYYDTYFDVYKNAGDSLKVDIKKGTRLINLERNTASDNIPNRAFAIIAAKLDSKNSFRLRSGIIPLSDSINLKEEFLKPEKKDSITSSSKKQQIKSLFDEFGFGKDSDFSFITDYKKYDFTISKAFTYNDELVYVLEFKPKKSSANYSGELYISAESYAVLKAKYKYAEGEGGQKLNFKFLLGFKYEELEREVLAIFNKNVQDNYGLKYVKVTTKQYYFFERSFTFIENNVRGKDKMKLKLDLLTEGVVINENEVLVINQEAISNNVFKDFTQKKKVPIETIKKYNPSIWSNYNIIAPNKAIKDFEN